jgi:selenocysteine insertion sequence-binding protein 2
LRAKETNNTKVKRRLVLGLREVCRGIKSRKVKMVILANNLDEYGALEEKLQEILDLANENEVPVISVLNKRKIGKAVGKNIKVSVVGVENPEGAFESFKKLKKMCDV